MGDHDSVIDFGGGLASSLGDDRLIAFAVNHDLPFAFAQVAPGFRVAHYGQTPLLELVHRRVDMPGDVVTQILAHQPHEVVARIADMIFGLVLVPLHTHIAVDGVKTLRYRATALDVCLFDADNLEIASPVPGFVGGPTARHTTAHDKDIGIYKNRFPAIEQSH